MFRQHARDTGRPVHVDTMARDVRFNSQIPAHPLSFDPKLYSPKVFQVYNLMIGIYRDGYLTSTN